MRQDYMQDMQEMHRVTLERFQIAAKQYLSEYAMVKRNCELSVFADDISMRLCFSLRSWLLSGPHKEKAVTYDRYVSWWDHFKADHFPTWANKRWPPKVENIILSEPKNVYVCPHADMKWPDQSHFNFMLTVQPHTGE